MVLGGRRILLYEMSDLEWQTRAKGKAKRIANKKKSADEATVNEAKEKEKARAARKRKARAAIDWPWSDVVAYVHLSHTSLPLSQGVVGTVKSMRQRNSLSVIRMDDWPSFL